MRFFVILALALVFSTQIRAQIVANPGDPALDAGFCAPGLPPISEPLWSGNMAEWTPAAGRPLMEVSLKDNPNAICNDGSPAKMFIRPAAQTLLDGKPNPLVDTYHIHLNGGGTCTSFTECRARFCAAPGTFNNKPGLMSSVGWPKALRGTGLFLDKTTNAFSQMNQVFVGYCSSDHWIGSGDTGTAVSNDPNDDPEDVSRIAFMGEHIVQAVLSELENGLTSESQTATVADYEMPPLAGAKYILVSGSSAGANGVRHHVDRIASNFSDAFTFSILDSGEAIDFTDPRIDWSLYPGFDTLDQKLERRVDQARTFHNVKDTALDESCKSAHPGMGLDESPCFDGFQLSLDHVSTPTLHRVSLGNLKVVRSVGTLVSGPLPPTIREITADSVNNLATGAPDYSVLGANCRTHSTFRSSLQMTAMKTLVEGQNLYEDLKHWVLECRENNQCPKVVKIAAPAVSDSSSCP